MVGKITLYGAIVSLLRFIFGKEAKPTDQPQPSKEEEKPKEKPKEPAPEKPKPKPEEPPKPVEKEKPKPSVIAETKRTEEPLCPSCLTAMKTVTKNSNDFISLFIYECPKCGTVSEFQYEYETNMPIRISHIFVKDAGESSTLAEAEGMIPYEHFSLDRLWAVGNCLCYPVIVKSEFTNKTSLIFIKAGSHIEFNTVEGFLINSQNVIGEIKMIREDTVSHFCNPYLAHLPRHEFTWVSSPTSRCDALETVYNIRFHYHVEGDSTVKLHKLIIIKDMPLKVMGLEVFVQFNSFNDAEKNLTKSELLHKIGISDIIMGRSEVNALDGFAVQRTRVTKHTLSSLNNENISPELRMEFWRDIRRFFGKYDQEAELLK